ncbi:MAG: hypothetical protein ACYCPT_09150 [Acidimicrobiales bacterium]
MYNNTVQYALNDAIKSCVREIDARLAIGITNGLKEVMYELPLTFEQNRMSQYDSQLYVYSELIKIYTKEKNYGKVNIKMKQDKAILIINLKLTLDDDERAARKKIIDDVMLK